MPVTVLPIPALSDNYVWLLTDEKTGAVAVVDPGDPAPVRTVIEAHGGRLDLILLTHHHSDHTGGAEVLRERYGARMVGAEADEARLPRLDQAVRAGDHVTLGDSRASVIDTPGHTLGHIAYYFADPPSLFCGDTLFSLGCGRLFEGTAKDLFDSFRRFDALPDQTRVYCGHEYTESNARFDLRIDPDNAALARKAAEVFALRAEHKPTLPSTLGSERACNPFLRAPDIETLARLRHEKDQAR
ncbi:hydroxyacylglutathione hydrolase [Acetobacter oeni]|uniref:Hydroxyacylglutathione hydrolase n=1 Tax=Acetobacter oeni TaxID=304077 RepID=A0A511XGH6_9PROT|nr:hydroxyacylglutathione hydrolase [Acetobacter oeni]MBB3881783.1 hydroxyacylglutathione hydrolase [Acetobacter oeni]NHO17415.1 hydroxyacylglutathione hydrolase [Acetobacter oeni]GBR02031.1 hydroxyacylglutathione hydrolase [Acetobacter oeni LMG 21952]GEN62045.1 hydroxyacylglutathione hydrolase [Acetobacter oeni]